MNRGQLSPILKFSSFPFVAYISSCIMDAMKSWRTIERLSKEEILSLQNRKLHSFINNYLYPFSPRYQNIFNAHNIDPRQIKTVSDLRHIPFTSKLDFISKDASQPEAYRDFILQPTPEKIKKSWKPAKIVNTIFQSKLKGCDDMKEYLTQEFRPIFMTFTTGTTNRPVPFLYSDYDIRNLYLSGRRMLDLFRIDLSERIVNLFPFAPHLAFWQVAFGGLASYTLALSTGGGKVLGTEGNIAAILRLKPVCILGVPSYIYHVLREAKEKGCQMDFIQRVILGASRVTPAFKEKCAQLLGAMGAKNVAILGTYGFTESRCAWAECPTTFDISAGYHLYPDKEIFEVIDPKTGEVKGEGEDGEIVYTSIDSRASVVIRYRTGDFVKGGISYGPCPHCGLKVPRLSSDITRLSDVKDLQLSKIKGSLVNLENFSVALNEVKEVEEWQLVIRKKDNDPFEIDEVVVYLSTRSPEANFSSLRDRIKEKILSYTEVAPNDIICIPSEEIVKRLELETANKEKRVVDQRPK